MNEWPDAKIRETALWYIHKHAMAPASWRYTRLGDAHPEVLPLVTLASGESPLVSFFLADTTWSLLTTRRVFGAYAGQGVDIAVLDVRANRFDDPKGSRGAALEVVTLDLARGGKAALQYETGRASMAPIYYFRYWVIKYPFLDTLKADPGLRT